MRTTTYKWITQIVKQMVSVCACISMLSVGQPIAAWSDDVTRENKYALAAHSETQHGQETIDKGMLDAYMRVVCLHLLQAARDVVMANNSDTSREKLVADFISTLKNEMAKPSGLRPTIADIASLAYQTRIGDKEVTVSIDPSLVSIVLDSPAEAGKSPQLEELIFPLSIALSDGQTLERNVMWRDKAKGGVPQIPSVFNTSPPELIDAQGKMELLIMDVRDDITVDGVLHAFDVDADTLADAAKPRTSTSGVKAISLGLCLMAMTAIAAAGDRSEAQKLWDRVTAPYYEQLFDQMRPQFTGLGRAEVEGIKQGIIAQDWMAEKALRERMPSKPYSDWVGKRWTRIGEENFANRWRADLQRRIAKKIQNLQLAPTTKINAVPAGDNAKPGVTTKISNAGTETMLTLSQSLEATGAEGIKEETIPGAIKEVVETGGLSRTAKAFVLALCLAVAPGYAWDRSAVQKIWDEVTTPYYEQLFWKEHGRFMGQHGAAVRGMKQNIKDGDWARERRIREKMWQEFLSRGESREAFEEAWRASLESRYRATKINALPAVERETSNVGTETVVAFSEYLEETGAADVSPEEINTAVTTSGLSKQAKAIVLALCLAAAPSFAWERSAPQKTWDTVALPRIEQMWKQQGGAYMNPKPIVQMSMKRDFIDRAWSKERDNRERMRRELGLEGDAFEAAWREDLERRYGVRPAAVPTTKMDVVPAGSIAKPGVTIETSNMGTSQAVTLAGGILATMFGIGKSPRTQALGDVLNADPFSKLLLDGTEAGKIVPEYLKVEQPFRTHILIDLSFLSKISANPDKAGWSQYISRVEEYKAVISQARKVYGDKLVFDIVAPFEKSEEIHRLLTALDLQSGAYNMLLEGMGIEEMVKAIKDQEMTIAKKQDLTSDEAAQVEKRILFVLTDKVAENYSAAKYKDRNFHIVVGDEGATLAQMIISGVKLVETILTATPDQFVPLLIKYYQSVGLPVPTELELPHMGANGLYLIPASGPAGGEMQTYLSNKKLAEDIQGDFA